MRKPLNTSIPEDLIEQIDMLVARSPEEYKNRSNFVEQAVRSYLGEGGTLREILYSAMSGLQKPVAASSLYESTLLPRLSVSLAEKRAIAQVALTMVKEGQTLFLDGGTTNIEFAKLLAQTKKGITVVTNSALICLELGQSAENISISTGGQFFPNSASYIGPTAEESVEKYYVDLAFFSTKGFVTQEGTFESAEGTLRIKQIVARHCGKLILLVDHSKFGQRSLFKVLDTSQIQTVVTDSGVSQEIIESLRQQGCEVLIAPADLSIEKD